MAVQRWRMVRRGTWEAQDEHGHRWTIEQTGARVWTVYCNGTQECSWAHTLAEAKVYVHDEVRAERDPAYAARRAARRAARMAVEA